MKITYITRCATLLSNLTPNPFPTREGEQESKPLSVSGRGLEKEVEIYCPGQDVEVLKFTQTICGENILPGFVLNIQGIW